MTAQTRDQLLDIDASKVRCRSLAGFVREAWPVIEPGSRYVHNWHIDAICAHLEAITYGILRPRLLINVPPGTMKSLLVSVLWPAWEWGPAGFPEMRYLTTSYSDAYVKRDSRRMRDLVLSEWYQERWGDSVRLVRSGETSFANDRTGNREGMPFASLTGGRGHRVIIDDPHSTEGAESEADRQRAIRIFTESVTTRLVEPATSAIVVIMQRLHTGDVSGTILSKAMGYEHVMLPMQFERDRRCRTSLLIEGPDGERRPFEDPRTAEGELLFPERFPREVVDRDKAIMGSFAVAGQFQQRPTQREGGLFKRAWLRIAKEWPEGTRWVRYWDLAATEDQMSATAAYTVGLLLGRQPDGRFIVGDVIRRRAEGVGVRKLIKDTAKADGPEVEIGFPQDPGQAGKVQGQDLVLMLAGHVARAYLETGSKVTRAEPVAAQAEAGNVYLLEGAWNETFIDEATLFPGSTFKDQVDALSGAFRMLLGATVFDVDETTLTVSDLTLESRFQRVAVVQMDQSRVGIVWAAYDRMSDVTYIYDAEVMQRRDMALLAAVFWDRGKWIPVVMTTESPGQTQADAKSAAERLASLGVEVHMCECKAATAYEVLQSRMSSLRLKVAARLTNWLAEMRRAKRDDKGQIVEENMHLMRATGILLSQALQVAVSETVASSDARGFDPVEHEAELGENMTGY